ncbi:hypothetical protein N2152v2_000130 [Parachlorella kessleri]
MGNCASTADRGENLAGHRTTGSSQGTQRSTRTRKGFVNCGTCGVEGRALLAGKGSQRAWTLQENGAVYCRKCMPERRKELRKFRQAREFYEDAKAQLYPRTKPKFLLRKIKSGVKWADTPSFKESWRPNELLADLIDSPGPSPAAPVTNAAPATTAASPAPAPAAASSPAGVSPADREPPQDGQDSWPVHEEELGAGADGELASPQSPGPHVDDGASPRSVLQEHMSSLSLKDHKLPVPTTSLIAE